MSAIIEPVTSNTRAGAYGASWGTIYDIELDPQVWQTWYQAFGKGFTMFDWLTIAGQTVSVKSDNITAFTDQAVEKAVQLNASGIAHGGHAAGNARTFILHNNEYLEGDGTTDNASPYLRAYDTVFIAPEFTNKDVPTQWFVTSVGTKGNNTTIYPMDATVQLTSTVTASSYLMVGPNLGGRGTGQPAARNNGATSDTFYTAIVDETAEIKGGVNAIQLYRNTLDKSGTATLWSKAQVETEFLLNAGMDKEILLGQRNTNTGNNVRTDGSANQAVRGTQGLWHWVESDGMEQAYAGSYDLAYFDQIKEYLRSQGVVDTTVATLAGSNLFKQIENTALDFLKGYSGGTDLSEGGKDYMSVGANIMEFKKNGINHQLCEVISFDNANSYAAMDTYFRDAGLVIPKSLATVKSNGIVMDQAQSAGDKVTIPNVVIGYLNNNGENRTRMVGPVAGVNGMGYPFTNQYDKVELYFKSEFMVIVNLANQMLKIVKEGTY